jgi:hypothetical protein
VTCTPATRAVQERVEVSVSFDASAWPQGDDPRLYELAGGEWRPFYERETVTFYYDTRTRDLDRRGLSVSVADVIDSDDGLGALSVKQRVGLQGDFLIRREWIRPVEFDWHSPADRLANDGRVAALVLSAVNRQTRRKRCCTLDSGLIVFLSHDDCRWSLPDGSPIAACGSLLELAVNLEAEAAIPARVRAVTAALSQVAVALTRFPFKPYRGAKYDEALSAVRVGSAV